MEKKHEIRIGSRESALAIVQAEQLCTWLRGNHPEFDVRLVTMKTTGDQVLDQALEKIGGKGLFVKELDRALLEGRTDLSVHSLKDVPMELPEELPLLAFSRREDPRDVLVLPKGRTELDLSLPVGCSSRRRMVQFQKLYPEARFEMIRGNVQTRLKKLDEGGYSATILAAAGLKRLGLEDRISRYFSVNEMIPAAGQGILTVQGRRGEDYTYLYGCSDPDAIFCARAERAFVRRLGGDCSTPVAAHARICDGTLMLLTMYLEEPGGELYRGMACGDAAQAEEIGCMLAERFLNELPAPAMQPALAKAETAPAGQPTLPGAKSVPAGQPTLAEAEAAPAGQPFSLQESLALAPRQTGKVWLVGAGPGDPGLLTLKGKQVLQEAEVVVYDALVGDGVLGMIPPDAECIHVGKRSSNHTMPQEQINELLAQKAREGKKVVRLKGGDPFLFGRGGEELEHLKKAGISFEVVPGIPSALAVPAYQGIPVTHRDYCSSVHIITGHRRKGEQLNLDFDALVKAGGTLVFLMGAAAMGELCRGLILAGMPEDCPAALLMQGTTAAQKRIVATVSTLEEEAKRQGVKTPAILVVGQVCSLAQQFSWYETLPLGGARVLLTRPKELIGSTAAKLRALGAEVLELPAICTEKIPDNRPLQEAFARLETYDWLVFTSRVGVRMFFEQLQDARIDVRRLGRLRLAVIGSGTGQELERHGLYPDLMPECFDGQHLGRALAGVCKKNERILLARAEKGSPELREELQGLQVEEVALYRTVYEQSRVIDEKQKIEDGSVDYVVFTSASTVHGFAAVTKGADYSRLWAVCIGTQTQAAAKALGLRTVTARQASIDSLLEALAALHQEQKRQTP